jgi:hypothetical protein
MAYSANDGLLFSAFSALVPSELVLVLFTRIEGVLLYMETIILSTRLPVLEEVEASATTQFLTSLTNNYSVYQSDIQNIATQTLLMEIFTYQMEERALFGCLEIYSNN